MNDMEIVFDENVAERIPAVVDAIVLFGVVGLMLSGAVYAVMYALCWVWDIADGLRDD